MTSIETINSTYGNLTLRALEQVLSEVQTSDFFGEKELEFCEALSRELMKTPGVRAYPELVALAFWLRKGELLKLKMSQQGVRKARGLAFHIPPANVDTIFLYSWIVSVLCGNSNVVRVSNRAGRATSLILSCLSSVFTKGFEHIAKNNLFIRYSHDEETLMALSRLCDLRIVWGGDSTVKSVRKVPVSPRALDIGFADRFSVALINAEAVLKCSEEDLQNLCMHFYNDAYLFNQKACSSPRIIFWVGQNEKIQSAKERFFSGLNAMIIEKKFFIDEPMAMYKLKSAYRGAIDNNVLKTTVESLSLIHHDLRDLKSIAAARSFDFGGGSFCSIDLSEAEELKDVFSKKDQTLSYYGFSKDEMLRLAQNIRSLGIDRIVPIGLALKFNTVWDGLDLIQTFSREIYVE